MSTAFIWSLVIPGISHSSEEEELHILEFAAGAEVSRKEGAFVQNLLDLGVSVQEVSIWALFDFSLIEGRE